MPILVLNVVVCGKQISGINVVSGNNISSQNVRQAKYSFRLVGDNRRRYTFVSLPVSKNTQSNNSQCIAITRLEPELEHQTVTL